jgi:hypothetical protein
MSKQSAERLRKIYKESRLKPPYDKWSLVRRVWVFQNERIPIIAIFIISLAVVVAIARANDRLDWRLVIIASLINLFYFLQIRLADEPKDFEHDNKYYSNRPVQRGVITLKELSYFKNASVAACFILAALTGSITIFLLACIQQTYSFLTREEFFMRKWLRKHFLSYQFSHYVQLFILDWFILSVIKVGSLHEKFIYFAFVIVLVFMIESSRTIGGTDGAKAKDRYSYRLGINFALIAFIILTITSVAFTLFLMNQINAEMMWLFILIIGLLVTSWSVIKYRLKPTTKNAEVMNWASIVMYLCCTLTLLISK